MSGKDSVGVVAKGYCDPKRPTTVEVAAKIRGISGTTVYICASGNMGVTRLQLRASKPAILPICRTTSLISRLRMLILNLN
jgi:hypothetical protein